MTTPISKKRKFVVDGVFKAELNEFVTRELSEHGYSGVEVRVTPSRTKTIILHELTSIDKKDSILLIIWRKSVANRAVRRPCCGVLRYIMECGAQGCEVVVSGKLREQRAKTMKFVDGLLMIHPQDPCNDYVDTATRHVLLRQGVLGIKAVEPKEEVDNTKPISEIKPIKPDGPAPIRA
ncbi:hypothetical protein WA026_014818 [Henosepilachna vigintioctopunctata]|uniref:40S ribosomal protein S3 n=1 Tax=Henosepilachna vigintioctopunctata TaxID=420089 RepID=A0AAW1URC2_9CUCU